MKAKIAIAIVVGTVIGIGISSALKLGPLGTMFAGAMAALVVYSLLGILD